MQGSYPRVSLVAGKLLEQLIDRPRRGCVSLKYRRVADGPSRKGDQTGRSAAQLGRIP